MPESIAFLAMIVSASGALVDCGFRRMGVTSMQVQLGPIACFPASCASFPGEGTSCNPYHGHGSGIPVQVIQEVLVSPT